MSETKRVRMVAVVDTGNPDLYVVVGWNTELAETHYGETPESEAISRLQNDDAYSGKGYLLTHVEADVPTAYLRVEGKVEHLPDPNSPPEPEEETIESPRGDAPSVREFYLRACRGGWRGLLKYLADEGFDEAPPYLPLLRFFEELEALPEDRRKILVPVCLTLGEKSWRLELTVAEAPLSSAYSAVQVVFFLPTKMFTPKARAFAKKPGQETWDGLSGGCLPASDPTRLLRFLFQQARLGHYFPADSW